MQRYIIVPIAMILLMAGCSRPPGPTPTEVARATATLVPTMTPVPPTPTKATPTEARVLIATAPPTGTPLPVPTATATLPPTPAVLPTPTISPTPTASPTPLPTKPPTPRPPANTPVPPASPTPAPGAAWKGEYFANPDLYGEPALVRSDADLNFDWGLGSPDPKIPVDHFSARWTRTVSLGAGRWRFHATTDDGVRVYVDGLLIIDQWHTTASVTYNCSVALAAGQHLLRVDFYDNIEQAKVRIWWEADDGSATDPAHTGTWRGEYFNNRNLSGNPVFGRDDPAVYFDWGEGGPGGGIGGQDFSVRWTRRLFLPGGRYLFKIKPDDGVRLWLDYVAIIDEWHDNTGLTTYTKELQVSDTDHTLVVEYYQGGGPASVKLEWQPLTVQWVGNLRTCLAQQESWIKVYRLAPNNHWEDLRPDGYGPNTADGHLNLFGVPLDAAYSWDGQPYRVELWVKGKMVRSQGNIHAGQPEFRIMPGADVQTAWLCGAELPTQ